MKCCGMLKEYSLRNIIEFNYPTYLFIGDKLRLTKLIIYPNFNAIYSTLSNGLYDSFLGSNNIIPSAIGTMTKS